MDVKVGLGALRYLLLAGHATAITVWPREVGYRVQLEVGHPDLPRLEYDYTGVDYGEWLADLAASAQASADLQGLSNRTFRAIMGRISRGPHISRPTRGYRGQEEVEVDDAATTLSQWVAAGHISHVVFTAAGPATWRMDLHTGESDVPLSLYETRLRTDETLLKKTLRAGYSFQELNRMRTAFGDLPAFRGSE